MRYILFFALALLASGCTEVIQLDLNDANPRVVIEGYVNDLPGPYYVQVGRSQGINDTGEAEAIGGALVIISGSDGQRDTLREMAGGLYATQQLVGRTGVTYYLTVESEGNQYTSASSMPAKVSLDTAFTEMQAVQGGESIVPVLEFQDPEADANYYNFVTRKDGFALPGFYAMDDGLRNGTYISRPLRNSDFGLKSGDWIEVELQCVEKSVYEYFYVLGQAAGTGMSQSATPANPQGNITGDAVLGCFSAHTVSKKLVQVP